MKIELLEETDSTNNYIKRYLSNGEDIVVCARTQTGGKGTKGRSFSSKEGGVYFSALRFFSHLSVRDAFRLMQHAAVAVCRTVEEYGAKPRIKWTNDVYVDGRKICGILIENVFSGEYLRSSIVGIGLNVSNALDGLSNIAITLNEATGRALSVEEVRKRLIRNFCETGLAESEKMYESRLILGRVRVTEGDKTYFATARRVLPDGRLEVECDGTVRALSSAEVSIGIM